MLNLITNEIIPKSLLTIECMFCELKWINYEVILHLCFLYVKHFSLYHKAEMMAYKSSLVDICKFSWISWGLKQL